MPKDKREKKTDTKDNTQEEDAFSIDPVFSTDAVTTDEAVEEVEKEAAPQEPEKQTHLRSIERPNAWKRFWGWVWDKKFITIPAFLLVVIAILLAIPATRYMALGWFWKDSVVVSVIDDGNDRPVTEATIKLAGMSAKTDAKGKATISNVPIGVHDLTIEKKNYQTTTVNIEVSGFASGKEFSQKVHATGRITDITVVNRLSGAVIKGALVTVSQDDKAKTDDNGKAQLVIPTDKKVVSVTVAAEGYIEQKVEIAPSKNANVELIPAGKMYFLSKQRGKIDVIRANFDGSAREIAVEGTGHEYDQTTTLLASRDWRFLLLKARREAGKAAALYLYDTTKGNLELIDQGNKAEFTSIGWSGHNFFYQLTRGDRLPSQLGFEAIKMLNAQSRKVSTIDESQVSSMSPSVHFRQTYSYPYILEGGIVFNRLWTGNATLLPSELTVDIVRVNSDGTGKKVIKSFPSPTISYIEAKLYEPQEVYYRINKNGDPTPKPIYAELANWVYREGVNGDQFDKNEYPTFLMSPDGTMSFWSEPRDGKNALLIGGKNAENEQVLASMSEFKAYGWLTNDYVLMQKNNSELYIASPAQLKAGKAPLKISDYHKPSSLFPGYGYGYGGQ